MIRKSTLILLLVALVAGIGLYYYQTKQSRSASPAETASKPVFPSVTAADIQTITLEHLPASDAAIQMARSGDTWQLTAPLKTPADQPSVDGLVDGLASASSAGSEPGAADRLKAYGLQPGAIGLSFGLKNGTTHKIVLGNKDFTNADVYALVDSDPNVYLLPASLLSSADKTADDLRDKTVLHFDTEQAASAEIKTASNDITLKKSPRGWDMTKPDAASADADSVSSMLSDLANAKMKSIASEAPDNLSKYGLTSPAVTFTVTNDIHQNSTLLIGKKQGENYYARDSSRPTVFEIDGALYNKLTQSPADLLDKTPLHVDESTLSQMQIHDSSGDIAADKKSGSEEWIMSAPDAVKGKSASTWKVFGAVGGLRADQVIEKPAANITAALAQPAFLLTLTDTAGNKRTLRITQPIGDYIYAQSSESSAVYKLKKSSLSDLDLKASDLAS